MAGVGPFAAYEDLFWIVLQHIVRVVRAVSKGHAAPRAIAAVDVGTVEAAVVEQQHATRWHGHGQRASV